MFILTLLNQIKNYKFKKDKAYALDKIAEDPILKELLILTFDKDVRYFVDVQKVRDGIYSATDCYNEKDSVGLNRELLSLLRLLASEEIRGNRAVNYCIRYATRLKDPFDKEMLLNVLENKVRLGIGATDINKYCAKFKIDQFQVMFAKRLDKATNVDWRRVYYIQPKIDGMRCICIKPANKPCKFYTRTGKDITSLKRLEAIINATYPNHAFVLDGEIESGTLEETGCVRRREEQANGVTYTIFGRYDYDEWMNRKFTQKYTDVYGYTSQSFVTNLGNAFRIIPNTLLITDSEEDFHKEIQKYTSQFIEQGYEGSVLKTADHIYQPSSGSKRSNDWLKVKPSLDSDAIILDVLEGEGEAKGQVGKFLVKWLDVEFELAPGKLKKDICTKIWREKENYIGERIEFQYQLLSAYGVPRHAFCSKLRLSE